MPGWCCKGAFGLAAARRSEAPRSAGLMAARAARFVRLTRRSCLNGANEVSAVSSATGHETEHRRGVGAQHRPPQSSAAAGPDAPLVDQRCRGRGSLAPRLTLLRPFFSSPLIAQLGYRAQHVGSRRWKAEVLEVGGNLLEQH